MNKFLLFIFFPFVFNAQVDLGSLYEELPNDSIYPLSTDVHTSLKPFIRTKNDNLSKISYGFGKDSLSKNVYLSPIFDIGTEFDKYASVKIGLGASLTGTFKNKFYFKLAAIQGYGKSKNKLFQPKSYLFHLNNKNDFSYTDIRGRISYTPNSIFNFQVGIDQNFIGEGNRSFLLSDYGSPYPFGQIRAKFWKCEYSILYQFYREINSSNDWKSKYSTSHYLSINFTKKINLSLFESVLFTPKDPSIRRGFDAEYLNPIVFFRPQEYSIGSSDNSFLGAQLTYRYKKSTLYAQGILDDFLLSEILAKNGYWANKYAYQLGIKGRFNKKNINYFYRIEANICRPYTYSHVSTDANYGNQGNVLAHPYGSNFEEILAEIKWQKSNWIFKGFLNYFLHGIDKNEGVSYGGNIYESYNSHPKEHNNYIGQGVKTNGINLIISTAYVYDKKTNLQLFLENHFQGNTYTKLPFYQLVIGIRSCLWNDYRNY